MDEMELTQHTWRVPGRNFEAKLEIRDGIPVLMLGGEIDVYTSPVLSGAIDKIIMDSPRDLVLDFHKIAFLDSSGISVLIHTHKLLEQYAKRLRLEHVEGHAYRVLDITGLVEILNVRKSDQEFAA